MQNACSLPKCKKFQSAIQWFHPKQYFGCIYTQHQLYISPCIGLGSKCKIQELMSLTTVCPSLISLQRVSKICLSRVSLISFSARSRRGLGVLKAFTSHAGGRRIGPRHRHFFSNLVVLFLSNHLFIGISSDTFVLIVFLSGVGVPVPGCAH